MPTKRGDFAIGFLGDKVVAAGGLGNNFVFIYHYHYVQLKKYVNCQYTEDEPRNKKQEQFPRGWGVSLPLTFFNGIALMMIGKHAGMAYRFSSKFYRYR